MAPMAPMAGMVVAGIGGARRPVAPEVLPPPPSPPPERQVQLPPEPQQPRAQPAVISPVMAVQPPDPEQSSPAERQVGVAELSHKIEDVIGRLDLFVEESLRLQQSLLRLRLRPRQPQPPQPDTLELSELPVGL